PVGGDHAAERRVRERGRLAEQARDEPELELGEPERAARLAREQRDDLVAAGLQGAGRVQEDALALGGGRGRPRGERLRRCLDRAPRLRRAARRHAGDHLAAVGVEVLERLLPGCDHDHAPSLVGPGIFAHARRPARSRQRAWSAATRYQAPKARATEPSAGTARARRRRAAAASSAPPTAAESSVIESAQPATRRTSAAHASAVPGTAAISRTATPALPASPWTSPIANACLGVRPACPCA